MCFVSTHYISAPLITPHWLPALVHVCGHTMYLYCVWLWIMDYGLWIQCECLLQPGHNLYPHTAGGTILHVQFNYKHGRLFQAWHFNSEACHHRLEQLCVGEIQQATRQAEQRGKGHRAVKWQHNSALKISHERNTLNGHLWLNNAFRIYIDLFTTSNKMEQGSH